MLEFAYLLSAAPQLDPGLEVHQGMMIRLQFNGYSIIDMFSTPNITCYIARLFHYHLV